jgi:hypothetical protein
MQGTKLSKFMESVEKVAGAVGEADTESEAGTANESDSVVTPAPELHRMRTPAPSSEEAQQTSTAPPAAPTDTTVRNPDPWAAILEAGVALLQGLAATRIAGGTANAMPPIQVERDPVTGQASVRLPLPDPAVLQKLAKAFEPWLH